MQKRIGDVLLPLSTQFHRIFGWFQDDVFRRLFLNTGKLLSASGISDILGLVVVALTARTLGPANYGILALVLTYEATIGKLVSFNAWQAIIKFGSEVQHLEDKTSLKQLLKFGFLLDISSAVLGTILAIALSGFVISLLGWDQSIRELLVLYSILILFSLNGTPIGVLRLYDRFDLLSYTAVLGAVIKLAGVTYCFFTNQSLLGFVIVYLITAIIGNLYQLLASLWVIRQQDLATFTSVPLRGLRSKFSGILDYVWTTNFNSTVRMLSRESDELILAALTTPSALGLYKIAKQFSKMLPKLTDPLYQSVYPELARLWVAGNYKGYLSLIKRSTLIVGFVTLLVWILFALFGKYIIIWTVGPVYQDAYWLAVLYMFALVIAVITFSFQPAMLAMGLPRESFKVQIIATVFYFILLIPLVGWWLGIMGAALSYVLYYVIWSCLMFARLRQQMRKVIVY